MTSARSHSAPRRTTTQAAHAARRRRGREGAAALEFALVLPLFVFLVLGLIDFGYMLYVVNTITNAAREGARRGVVQQQEGAIEPAAIAAAQNYMAASGIDASEVTADRDGDDVVVTVTIPGYTNITGFSYNLPGLSSPDLAASRTLSSVSTMRWEFAPGAGP